MVEAVVVVQIEVVGTGEVAEGLCQSIHASSPSSMSSAMIIGITEANKAIAVTTFIFDRASSGGMEARYL